jgi:hypothetical protein
MAGRVASGQVLDKCGLPNQWNQMKLDHREVPDSGLSLRTSEAAGFTAPFQMYRQG